MLVTLYKELDKIPVDTNSTFDFHGDGKRIYTVNIIFNWTLNKKQYSFVISGEKNLQKIYSSKFLMLEALKKIMDYLWFKSKDSEEINFEENDIFSEKKIFEFKKGSLILLSGVPWSWKSTFIERFFKSNWLMDYVISSDEIRERYFGVLQGFDENANLTSTVDQASSELVFKTMRDIADYRCKNQLTTVIDATSLTDHSRKSFVEDWWKEMYTIIFDDANALKYNFGRKESGKGHYVPSHIVEKMMGEFQKYTNIKGMKLLKAEEIGWIKEVFETVDIAEKTTIVIGDSHGIESFKSYIDSLEKEYSIWDIKPNFIFAGDLVDRWPKSIENLIYLIEKSSQGNMRFVMWNHDRKLLNNINEYLSSWNITETIPAWYKTIKDLLEFAGNWLVNIKRIQAFLNSFEPFAILSENGINKYFISHAPILPPNNIWNIRKTECIYGMEKFKSKNSGKLDKENDYINYIIALDKISKKTGMKYIFWHIDFSNVIESIQNNKNLGVYSIEGSVDDWWNMIALVIKNWKEEIKAFPSNLKYRPSLIKSPMIWDFDKMEENKIIHGRKDHPKYWELLTIYKYHKRVFYDHLWGTFTPKENDFLQLARWIVLDPLGNIISFPFEKVFNYWETTKDWKGWINHNKIPEGEYEFVDKINWFLWVISPDPYNTNELLIHTQGSLSSHDFNRYITDLLSKDQKENILDFFKRKGKHTLTFEVIHKEDPHIVKYNEEDYALYLIWCRNIQWPDWKAMNLLSEIELDWLATELWFKRMWHKIDSLSNILWVCKTATNIEWFMVRDIQTWKHLVKMKTAYYLITKFLSRMNDWNYRYLYTNKDKFIQEKQIEEEFFPIVDYIYENQEKFKLYSKEEKLKAIQDYIQNEMIK